jgi:uncharacterized membrane protein YedE/YeeE
MHISSNMDLLSGAIGGSLLGLSAGLFMHSTGKNTGCSGILNGLIGMEGSKWKFSYLSGMWSSGLLLRAFYPSAFGEVSNLSNMSMNVGALIAAGLMVGFGTRLGNGCTSGHGLCGLSRQSPRSLAAVLTFMSTGALAAYVAHLPSMDFLYVANDKHSESDIFINGLVAVAILGAAFCIRKLRERAQTDSDYVRMQTQKTTTVTTPFHEHLVSYASGLLFGLGLGISGMTNTAKVSDFLNFTSADGWDPTLMAVLGTGVMVVTAMYHYMHRNDTTVALDDMKSHGVVIIRGKHPKNMNFSWKLFTGAALFGCGWGLAGFCPGPAVVSFAGLIPGALVIVPSMLAGMLLKDILIQ